MRNVTLGLPSDRDLSCLKPSPTLQNCTAISDKFNSQVLQPDDALLSVLPLARSTYELCLVIILPTPRLRHRLRSPSQNLHQANAKGRGTYRCRRPPSGQPWHSKCPSIPPKLPPTAK